MYALLIVLIVVEAFIILAMTIKIQNKNYDGEMVIHETDKKKTFSLEMETNPDDFDKKKEIVLKIKIAPE